MVRPGSGTYANRRSILNCRSRAGRIVDGKLRRVDDWLGSGPFHEGRLRQERCWLSLVVARVDLCQPLHRHRLSRQPARRRKSPGPVAPSSFSGPAPIPVVRFLSPLPLPRTTPARPARSLPATRRAGSGPAAGTTGRRGSWSSSATAATSGLPRRVPASRGPRRTSGPSATRGSRPPGTRRRRTPLISWRHEPGRWRSRVTRG